MGKRLSKIYTRTGDDGSTGLSDGSRIPKYAPRMECIGTVDELNSQIGVLRAGLAADDNKQALLSQIQHDLFDLGGELATPELALVKDNRVGELEAALDEMNSELQPLTNFILPAGSEAVARCHMARAICRRCERCLTSLSSQELLRATCLSYINRLSDLLFVMARHIAKTDGQGEVLWQQQKP